jgi:hypothetical protein
MKRKNSCIDCGKEITLGSKKGRCKSCARKYQYTIRPESHPMLGKIGKNAGNYIDGRTFKKYYCVDCKKEIPYITYHKNKGRRCCSCEVKRKHREKIINSKGSNNGMYGVHRFGKDAPNFINGLGKEPYPLIFNNQLREEVRKRDNYQCQNPECNMTQEEHFIVYGRDLHVHHIDYNKDNCNKDNLTTLCQGCNTRVNYNRDYWMNYFQKKVCKI